MLCKGNKLFVDIWYLKTIVTILNDKLKDKVVLWLVNTMMACHHALDGQE
jgi:hypothetical protein